jgi:hypothetical protein
MLAFLCQGLCQVLCPGPLFRPPEQRACDAGRDTAVDILCAAAADGRLTMTELDERVGPALTARTLTQLARLIADLIGPRAAAASPGPPPAPAAPGDRWAVLRSLLPSNADSMSGNPSCPVGSPIVICGSSRRFSENPDSRNPSPWSVSK